MKLLIVDDSQMIRDRIKNQVRYFENVSIVGEAGNGIQAMEMMRLYEPDLVFLDLHMPEMGGMEVLKQVKTEKMKTKVCILTNYNFPQYQTKCMSLGADFFLIKSTDFNQTSSVIARVLKESETNERNTNINRSAI